jgi:amino acid transporter
MPIPESQASHPTAGDVERGLERTLGVRSLSASILNITVGGGIFLAPAVVAARLGSEAWVAYLVCAVAFGLIVLCFAEAGSRVSMTGGPYAYVGTVFGPFLGFQSGVLIWLFGTVAHAGVASAFAQAVNALVPGAGVGLSRVVVIVLVFVLFTSVNVRGASKGARLVEVGTVAKLVPLVCLVVFGAFAVSPANLAWSGGLEVAKLGRVSLFLLFAFAGVESALVPSGEVKDPARTVPRAIAIAMTAVTVLYIGVQVVAQGILGDDLAKYPDAPLAAAAGKAFGPAGGMLLLLGAAISMFSHLSGMMLAMPRALFAFARDGYLPAFLARVNPSTHVPTAAIVTHATLVSVLAISGTFTQLATFADVMVLVLYLMCCLAAFELRRRDIQEGGTPFRMPGGAVVPWLAVAMIGYLLSGARATELLGVGAILAIATVLYAGRMALRRSRLAT